MSFSLFDLSVEIFFKDSVLLLSRITALCKNEVHFALKLQVALIGLLSPCDSRAHLRGFLLHIEV